MSQAVSLESLMTPSKTVQFSYPGHMDFKVDLCYLSREELIKLRKRCVTTKFDKKTRQPTEMLDEDRFMAEYVKSVVQGWSGLKYRILEELVLIDTADLDLDSELSYSEENALALMKNSSEFDTWVTETVGDLENFTTSRPR